MRKIKAGFVGFGEINTPRAIIERKCAEAVKRLEDEGIEVLKTGPVSDDPEGCDVKQALAFLSGLDFDLLIVCVAGWIPSHAVISVIEPFKHKPMLLWGLTGWREGDRFITTADQAGTTALRKPMADMGYCFKYVVTRMGKAPDMNKITAFAKAARAVAMLRKARIGMMGYRDMDLYGTLHDGVSLRGRIGPEVEIFEMLEMAEAMKKQDPAKIKELKGAIRKRWKFVKEPADETLENTIKLYLALHTRITGRGYEAVSLKDVDGVKKFFGFAPAGAFMLIHEEDDICTIPENDTMGAVTQLMTRYVTGQIGAYMEFYEFLDDGVLMGVPDYVPSEIVDGPVTVMPTAFGEFGEGLLNVSKVKTGLVTLARLTYSGSDYSMHVVTGEAKLPPKWEEAGWTPPAPQLPGLEITLDGSVDDFTGKVLGQHYILSYGDNTETLRDLCGILGVKMM